MGAALEIRTDLASPARLRALARRERSPRTATRLLAIASALEGKSRAEAARLAGTERQALRDAVVRYNAEGLEGLRDRPKPGRRPALTEAEQAVLLAAVFHERLLSHCLLDGYDAIVEACCEAWNALTPDRLRSLTAYPWIARVTS